MNLVKAVTLIALGLATGIMGCSACGPQATGCQDVPSVVDIAPGTRFHIGTAASTVAASMAPLGLSHTGADAATLWSPEAIGEEGEDFPPLAILRHTIWQPLGLMPSDYPLPGERATFCVPRSTDNSVRRGRRLMYMRDLACCANGMAFSSTPSDLVRFALATSAGSLGGNLDGNLAGGMVMSLITERDSGIVIAGAAGPRRIRGRDTMITRAAFVTEPWPGAVTRTMPGLCFPLPRP